MSSSLSSLDRTKPTLSVSTTTTSFTYFAEIAQRAEALKTVIDACLTEATHTRISLGSMRRVLVGPPGSGKTKILELIAQNIEEAANNSDAKNSENKRPLLFRISMRRVYGRTSDERLLFFLRNLRLEIFLQLDRALDENTGLFGRLAKLIKRRNNDLKDEVVAVHEALDSLGQEIELVEKMLGGDRTDEFGLTESSSTSKGDKNQRSASLDVKGKASADEKLTGIPGPSADVTLALNLLKALDRVKKSTEEDSQSVKLQRKSVISSMNIEPPLYQLFSLLTRAQIPTIMLIDNLGRLPFEERATLIGMLNRLPLSCLILTLRREQFDEEIAEQFETHERIILHAMTGQQLLKYPSPVLPNYTERPKEWLAHYFLSQIKKIGIDQDLPIFPLTMYQPFMDWVARRDNSSTQLNSKTREEGLLYLHAEFANLYETYLLDNAVEPNAVRVARELASGMSESEIRNCLLLGYRDKAVPGKEQSTDKAETQFDLLCHGPSPLAYRMRDRYWLSPLLGYMALSLSSSVTMAKTVPARALINRKKPTSIRTKNARAK